MRILAGTAEDEYRKPRIAMYQVLEQVYAEHGMTIGEPAFRLLPDSSSKPNLMTKHPLLNLPRYEKLLLRRRCSRNTSRKKRYGSKMGFERRVAVLYPRDVFQVSFVLLLRRTACVARPPSLMLVEMIGRGIANPPVYNTCKGFDAKSALQSMEYRKYGLDQQWPRLRSLADWLYLKALNLVL